MCTYISSTKATWLVHHNFHTFSHLTKPGDQYEPCSPSYATFCILVFLRHLILWTNKYHHSPSGSPTETLYSYLLPPIHNTQSTNPPPGFFYLHNICKMKISWSPEEKRSSSIFLLHSRPRKLLNTSFIHSCFLSTVTCCHMHHAECLC